MTDACAPARGGAQMAFDGRMSYGDRPGLDTLFDAQHPLSTAHDKFLFIVWHQTSEQWMHRTPGPGSIAIHGMTDLCERAKH